MNLNKKQAEFATIYVNNPEMTLVDISKEMGTNIINWTDKFEVLKKYLDLAR